MASAKGVDTADGRLWVFNLKSEDIKKRKQTLSKLSITAQFTSSLNNIRVFDSEAYQGNYKYILAEKRASTGFVERRMELAVNSYLRESFPSGNLFSDYLIEIDKFLDKHGVEGVGNIFATLDVSVPGRVFSLFSQLPRDFSSLTYATISARVQEFLRKVVPAGYIFESKVFKQGDHVMYPLLVYRSLPILTRQQSEGVFYWDFANDDTRMSVVTSDTCKANLRSLLQKLRPDIPGGEQGRYEDSDVNTMIAKVAASKMPMKLEVTNFLNLCDLESSILRGLVRSAKFLHRFEDATNPEEKLEALAKFGSEFTETFNEDLGGDYAGKSLRPLGSLLILEIAKVLDPTVQSIKPTAILETMVVQPDFDFDGAALLDGKATLEEKDLLFHQRILNA
jgi:hypothetical protein